MSNLSFLIEQLTVAPHLPAAWPVPTAVVSEREIYARHADSIYRFLHDMLGSSDDAADATQETFVRAFRNLDALREQAKLKPWLFGIARNVAREQLRSRARRRRLEAAPPVGTALTPEEALIGRQAAAALRRALAVMSPDRRSALLLRVDHGLSYADIAQTLGWSLSKAKVEVHRARQRLLRELRKEES